jgi:hypothetical protein
MSDKVDKQECAKLTIEAYVLTKLIINRYRGAVGVVNPDSKARRVYKKAWQRFGRRADSLDAIIDALDGSQEEIYVGLCNESTLYRYKRLLTTLAGNTIHYDIAEFLNRQP